MDSAWTTVGDSGAFLSLPRHDASDRNLHPEALSPSRPRSGDVHRSPWRRGSRRLWEQVVASLILSAPPTNPGDRVGLWPSDGPHPQVNECPSPVSGKKAGSVMEHALKHWKCKNCGRFNNTVVALDGTAKCPHCARVLSIQPSRDYLSGFSLLRPELPRWSEGRWL